MQIDDTKALGQVIRLVREGLGLKQEDLALAANMSRRLVIEIEGGKRTARVEKVLDALNALGVVIDLTPPPGTDIEIAPPSAGPELKGHSPSVETTG